MFGFSRKANAAKTEAALEAVIDALVLIASSTDGRSEIATDLRKMAMHRGGMRGVVLGELSRRISAANTSAEPATPTSGERLDALMNRFDN